MAAPGVAGEVAERDRMLRALATLRPADREALLLVAWDGLDAAAAATVLGVRPNTFHARLSRARARLTGALEAADADPAPLATLTAQEG